MIELLLMLPLGAPQIEQSPLIETQTVVTEQQTEIAPIVTWESNPNNCDQTIQWIASEAPFYCIDKPKPTKTKVSTKISSKPIKNESGDNLYAWGNCTHWAKQMRPDLPNSLGNARTWVSRASALGYSTGNTPQTGAIGQKGNHVVYVTGVNSDGTFNLSEKNYEGLNVISYRTVGSSGWQFIF